MKPVTDPALLAQLDAPLKPVTDERVLFQLDNDSSLSAVPESLGGRVAAGMGKAVYDVGRGAGQAARSVLPTSIADMVGLPNQADIDAARKMDAPLMATGGGTAGNILGNVAMFAPTAMIPGANTVTGAALGGAAMGALQPTSGDESRLKNAAIGAAAGGGTQAAVGKLASAFGTAKTAAVADAATLEAQNATRDAALKAGQAAGYVVPPSSVKSGIVNQTAESIGGKIATAQEASLKNAKVTDTLARAYIGMAPDSVMSKAALADAREVAAEPYRQIAKLSPEAKEALDAWKQANFDARMQWNYFRKSGNPQAYEDAQIAGKAAEDALNLIESEATKVVKGNGAQQFIDALKDARVKIAKISTVESALTKSGHVDANLIAKMGERLPLQGELKTIADFAGNFPKALQTPEKVSGMAHALRPTIGGTVGTVLGGPAGGAAGAVVGVAAPYTMREMLLSGPGQRLLARPSYGPGATGTIADMLANPALRRTLPAAGAASALQER